MKTISKSRINFKWWLRGVLGAVGLSCLIVSLPSQAAETDASSQVIEFNRDIRPILSDKCYTCHGPDSAKRLSKLRFDTEEGAKQDLGKGRYAIVAGDWMPLGRESLSSKEIGLLRARVDQGAKWQKHWSLIPPQRPELLSVRNQAWPKNDIDRFVLARLEKEGLIPNQRFHSIDG